MKQYQWSKLSASQQASLLKRPALANSARTAERVSQIIERVRAGGDAALLDLTRELDGVDMDRLEVEAGTFESAGRHLSPAQRDAIHAAAENIARFHAAQLPTAIDLETQPGVRCQRVSRPLPSVGLYVPAGSAPLPSTALMLGIPARLAGCPVRVLCSPPRADGEIDSAVLYAAHVAGVNRVFKLGGAQAIAAMAYGTETVPKATKIFGPGNTWVTEAKAQVDRDPAGAARDFPAGPSEVLVIADDAADACYVASDLLSQAEHGPDSQVLLVTTSQALATDVDREIERQMLGLRRREIIDQALAHSATILVESLRTAISLANSYAPEHLILQVENPRRWLDQVISAGSVFLGPWAPESVGDYCSGTNHVLPTYGYADRYSSLGSDAFLRSMTVQELTSDGLRGIGPTARTLAELEGLDAHALAITERLRNLGEAGST